MVKKIHLKKKIKIKIRFLTNKFSIIFILFLIFLFITFKYINTKVSPVIGDYAKIEAKALSTYIINKAISDNISEILNTDELFLITKNSNNEINTIDFNPIIVNKSLTEITKYIHEYLLLIEKGDIDSLSLPESNYYSSFKNRNKGIIFEIPSGVVFNNALLSNIGPKVPVRITFIGDIISNINTKVTNYGINNALVEINLHIKVTEKVVLPISASEVDIELTIPLAIKLIQGNIPSYYLNGLLGNSNTLNVPVE